VQKIGRVLVVAVALTQSCSRGPAPADFSDSLSGPVSPYLAIPYDSYELTPAGLRRAFSISGTHSGVDRPIVKTVSGSYLARDFVFEVSVLIPEQNEDIAYVGFGEAVANAAFHNEVSNAFIFRIHHIDGIRRIDTAAATRRAGQPPLPYLADLTSIGNYTPGRNMRFRIERRGDSVRMSIPELAGAEHAYRLSDYPGLFDAGSAHLFIGNTTEGTIFSDLAVSS
jgi:hypothetical protein